MRLISLAFLFFISSVATAQTIQGKVVDTLDNEIKGAVITLIDSISQLTINYAIAKIDGRFSFPLSAGMTNKLLILSVRHVGFMESRMLLDLSKKELIVVRLTPSAKLLKEIILKSDIPIELKGDTTVFSAQKYLSPEDKKLKDLFIKMPGFIIDEKGRLTYKGNTVEKLFIDGDDPAGNNYGLLTKNASVDFVNKIEVIDHFDENRLMRSVRRTDKVAVNIITKEEYRMRITGTVDLGSNIGKKRMADFTTSFLGKRFKELNFANGNNAGESLDENFKGELYESLDEKTEESNKFEREMNMINIDQLRLPQLDDRITLHNNDLGLASVMSIKAGNYTKLNGQFGLSKTSQWIQQYSASSVNLGSNSYWKTENKERQNQKELGMFSTISFKRDNGSNHTSTGYLMLKKGKKYSEYNNLTSGSIQDSLYENLQDYNWLYSAVWNHTIRIGKNVMRVLFKSERNDGRQDYSVQTLRMLKYFKLDSAYKYYLQNSSSVSNIHSVELKLNGKKRRQKFEIGWNTSYVKTQTGYDQFSHKRYSLGQVILNYTDLSTRMFSSTVFGKTVYAITPKVSMDVNSKFGVSSLSKDGNATTIPQFKNELTFSRNLGKKSTAFLGGEWERGFSDWSKFMPALILTGNASFGNGLNFTGPSENYTIVGGFWSFNILKNRSFILTANYTISKFSYGTNAARYPEYSISGYERYKNNSSSSLIMSQSLFLRFIKSVLKIYANWMDNSGFYQLNGKNAIQRMMNAGLGAELNTGFDWPINFNLEGRISYFKNQWNDLPYTSNIQYAWNGKVRYKLGKQIYMASRLKYYQYTPKKGFNAVDYYVIWTPNKQFDFKLEAINLMNQNTIEQRYVDAVSETTSSFLLNKRFLLFSASISF